MTDIPFGPLGQFVFKRTYARTKEDGSLETFEETIDRVLKATEDQLHVDWDPGEKERARDLLLQLKGSVAGRFLWQLGTSTVNRIGLASLQNCAAVVVDTYMRPFLWAFDMLMLGSGVGFNIQLKNVYSLPTVQHVDITHNRSKDADYIVPDSREGWVLLLQEVLRAHFETGKSFSFSTVLVRSRGQKINGFGGTASGDLPLVEGILKINEVLNTRAGDKLRPIDVLDVMNLIGHIVVSGNVRRSAQIAIGDHIDLLYMKSKDWSLFNIPGHRAMSNNSVICGDTKDLPEGFWEGYKGNGEAFGLININLCKKIGRLGEPMRDNAVAVNPCAEQPLANYESCCLAEIFLPNITSKEELLDIAIILYKINKHSLCLPCHHPETQAIVHKNMRMGIGVTGWMQATEEQLSWLSDTYKNLQKFDIVYSKKHSMPRSIRLTTVKPSGTLSLIAGVTSGIGPGYARYYIRRVRLASNSPLVPLLRASNYPIEYSIGIDKQPVRDTLIVSFPCESPEHTTLAKDLTAIEQLEWIKKAQTLWSDNAVSCTVYYSLDELNGIRDWLDINYKDNIKSVSFMLRSDHGFIQPPIEAITKEVYEHIKDQLRPMNLDNMIQTYVEEVDDSLECDGGACPIR